MLEVDKLTAVIALVIVVLFVIVIFLLYRKMSAKLGQLTQQCSSYDALLEQLHHHFLTTEQTHASELKALKALVDEHQQENVQVSQHLEFRIKNVQTSLNESQKHITNLNNEQPADKLYSRAMKLVNLGADLEEIMRECEMPRAEAEMLMSMHKK